MSAFMVTDTTINNVVNWLRREVFCLSLIPHLLKGLGFETAAGWAEDLGQAMFQLNIRAVDAGTETAKPRRFACLITVIK
jgi:hypothetical protein